MGEGREGEEGKQGAHKAAAGTDEVTGRPVAPVGVGRGGLDVGGGAEDGAGGLDEGPSL